VKPTKETATVKSPVINLDELELVSHENGPFAGKYGIIGERIGAKKLGYNLTVCPPGKAIYPFHNHHINEEMFFIIEGEGMLRFGDKEYPLRKHDVIACPPGKRDVAHQIVNTGTTDLKFLALSTAERNEVCEYPDSNKVGIRIGDDWDKPDLRAIFRAEQTVDYWDREF
jgi:uncharacterized cupin superfamily protein